jgi:hypothetical protein
MSSPLAYLQNYFATTDGQGENVYNEETGMLEKFVSEAERNLIIERNRGDLRNSLAMTSGEGEYINTALEVKTNEDPDKIGPGNFEFNNNNNEDDFKFSITKGDGPKDIGRGILKGFVNLYMGAASYPLAIAESKGWVEEGTVNEWGENLENYISSLGETETLAGGLAEGISQYLVPGLGYYKLFGALMKTPQIARVMFAVTKGNKTTANLIKLSAVEAATVATASNPDDGNLLGFVMDIIPGLDKTKAEGIAREFVNEIANSEGGWTASDVLETKFKNILGDFVPAMGLELALPAAIGLLVSTAQGLRQAAKNPKLVEEVIGDEQIKQLETEAIDNNVIGNEVIDDVSPSLDELGFYSKASEEIKKITQNKGSGQQYKSMLIKAGVKQDELDWLGLDEVLSKGKVTKAEIEQQINDNRVRLVEVNAIDDGTGEAMNWSSEPERITPEEAYGDDYIAEQAEEIMEDFNSNLSEYSLDDVPMTQEEAMAEAIARYDDNPVERYVDENTGYTITGNDDLGYSIFRRKEESDYYGNRINEATFDSSDTYNLLEMQLQAENIARDYGDLSEYGGSTRHKERTVDKGLTGDNYTETKLILEDSKDGDFYEEAHYDEANIVASIRHTDRIADDGSKVFFVEEIQSDWGQQGRRDGFKLDAKEYKDMEIKIKKSTNELEQEINKFTFKEGDKQIPFADWYYAKRAEQMQSGSEYDRIMANGPRPDTKNYPQLTSNFFKELKAGLVYRNGEIAKAERNVSLEITKSNGGRTDEYSMGAGGGYRAIEDAYAGIDEAANKKYNKVPKAPFVTDTNKWTALTIKRLMAKAEEEGYDSIAFSAGIIHANRWNNPELKTYYDKVIPSVISKVVGKIDKSSIGTITIPNEGIRPSELDDFPQLSIKLTPKIKEAVKKGQALFSASGLAGVGLLAQNKNSEVENDSR